MLSWKDYYAQEQVRQERLREAERERTVRMLSRKIKAENYQARQELLKRIGYSLVIWGDALLRRVAERNPARFSWQD